MSASRPSSPALIAATNEVAAAKKRLLEWAELEDARHVVQSRSAFRQRLREGLYLALEIGLQHLSSQDRRQPSRWERLARLGSLVLRVLRRS